MSMGEFWPQASQKVLWHLESTADSSGNGRTLTNYNVVTFETGKFAKGANFGSSNTNKYLGYDDIGITPKTDAFSVLFWAKVLTAPASGLNGIYRTAKHSNGEINIAYDNNSGTYRLVVRFCGTGSTWALTHNVTLPVGEWHMISFATDSSGNASLRLDGVEVDTGSRGSYYTNSDSYTYIGRGWPGSGWSYFSGMLDEFVVFNYCRTVAEDKAWYAHSIGRR